MLLILLTLGLCILAVLAHVSDRVRWLRWTMLGMMGLYVLGAMVITLFLAAVPLLSLVMPEVLEPAAQKDAFASLHLPFSFVTTLTLSAVFTGMLTIFSALVTLPPTRKYVFRFFPKANPESSAHAMGLMLVAGVFVASIIQAWLLYDVDQIVLLLKHANLLFETVTLELALVILSVVGVGVGVKRTWPETFERLGFRKLTPLMLLKCLGMACALFVLMNVASEVIIREYFPETHLLGKKIHDAMLAAQPKAEDALIFSFFIALGAGVGEEIFFRGLLQPIFGLHVATILFTVIHSHYGITPIMVSVLLMGYALAWIKDRWGLSASIFVHCAYDFIALLQNFIMMKWDR